MPPAVRRVEFGGQIVAKTENRQNMTFWRRRWRSKVRFVPDVIARHSGGEVEKSGRRLPRV